MEPVQSYSYNQRVKSKAKIRSKDKTKLLVQRLTKQSDITTANQSTPCSPKILLMTPEISGKSKKHQRNLNTFSTQASYSQLNRSNTMTESSKRQDKRLMASSIIKDRQSEEEQTQKKDIIASIDSMITGAQSVVPPDQ